MRSRVEKSTKEIEDDELERLRSTSAGEEEGRPTTQLDPEALRVLLGADNSSASPVATPQGIESLRPLAAAPPQLVAKRTAVTTQLRAARRPVVEAPPPVVAPPRPVVVPPRPVVTTRPVVAMAPLHPPLDTPPRGTETLRSSEVVAKPRESEPLALEAPRVRLWRWLFAMLCVGLAVAALATQILL